LHANPALKIFLNFSDEQIVGKYNVLKDPLLERQAYEAKCRTMMDTMEDLVFICTSDCKIKFINRAMIDRIGRNATGEICFEALHGLDEKCGWCNLNKILKGKTDNFTIVSPLDNKTFHKTDMPINNVDGTTSKMTIYRDISNLLEAISEKEKAQAQLFHSQKLQTIGTLAGGIAHDFNNILFPVIGLTEMLLEKKIESEQNKGSSFSIELAVAALKQKIAPCIDKKTNHPLQGNILIVDDEKSVKLTLKRILEKKGFSTPVCNDSVKALDVFTMNPDHFNLIISDLTMPNMSGDTFCMEVSKIRPDIPILLLTGYYEGPGIEKDDLFNINMVLTKPLEKIEVLNAVNELIK